jgi:hypothetical protein
MDDLVLHAIPDCLLTTLPSIVQTINESASSPYQTLQVVDVLERLKKAGRVRTHSLLLSEDESVTLYYRPRTRPLDIAPTACVTPPARVTRPGKTRLSFASPLKPTMDESLSCSGETSIAAEPTHSSLNPDASEHIPPISRTPTTPTSVKRKSTSALDNDEDGDESELDLAIPTHLRPRASTVCPTNPSASFSTPTVSFSSPSASFSTTPTRAPTSAQTPSLKQLDQQIAAAKDRVRTLRLVKTYRTKNDLNRLQELIDKWRSTAQQLYLDVHEGMQLSTPLKTLIDSMQVPYKLLDFDEENDCFK